MRGNQNSNCREIKGKTQQQSRAMINLIRVKVWGILGMKEEEQTVINN